MQLSHPNSDIYIPWEGVDATKALGRTTHLCIGAHPDDIEAMAFDGICACFNSHAQWFTGVTVTDGAGSARTGPYAGYSDEQMLEVRRREQRKAAFIGNYSIQFQLGYSSAQTKDPHNAQLQSDLMQILQGCRPQVVYLHQPADKHDTHVAVFAHALKALRALPAGQRPQTVYGTESWRNLDWVCDTRKTLLDAGGNEPVGQSLMGVFDSQNRGGKRFDIAVPARWRVNATFNNPHEADVLAAAICAIDMTALVADPQLSVQQFIEEHIDAFRADVAARVSRFCG